MVEISLQNHGLGGSITTSEKEKEGKNTEKRAWARVHLRFPFDKGWA